MVDMLPKIYGKWQSPVSELVAGHIEGAQLRRNSDGLPRAIALQFQAPNNNWYTLEFPFLDGMYFLSLLRAIQLDENYPMPDDTRSPDGPTGKAN